MKRLLLVCALAVAPLASSLFLIPGPTLNADNGPQHRVRSLQFGVSGGNVNDVSRRFCCSGTLGALVQSNGTQYILSNNHVMGLSGQAVAGQDISQPGLIDNGCRVSTVVADFTAAPPLNSNVDAAIAQLRPGLMNSSGAILDIGNISSTIRTPAVGLSVQKSGRTTGHTNGTISSVSTTVNVRYPRSCGSNNGPVFTFTNQVVVGSSSFSAGGDSGSMIVTTGSCPQPVALLFAGSSSATIGNPIGQVLQRLGTALGGSQVSVVGSCNTGLAFEPGIDLGPSEAAVEFAVQSMKRRERNLMSRAGVLGVGVGAAEENNTEAVIVIYVDRNSARPALPRTVNGIRVRVVPTDPILAF